MTVEELIEILEDLEPTAEVRIAHQPEWPMEYTVGEVVECGPNDGEEDDDADVEDDDREGIVYIGEGTQLGYLPEHAVDELGW